MDSLWRKSSWSGTDPETCIEVANLATPGGRVVGLRDSKDPEGPRLYLSPAEWAAFVDGVKAG